MVGREAEAEEQLLRRSLRLFAADERSFRMDRRSPAAAALREAVSDVLPRFLGSYTDEILAEYIVILVCNGKHQYQARDDLEAFLGDDSAKFVSWLWSYLSKKVITSGDSSGIQHGLTNEIQNRNGKKNLQVDYACLVNSEISSPQEHHGLQKNDSTEGQNVARRRISSTITVTPERFVDEQCYGEGQHQKKDQSTSSGRSFSALKPGVAARTAQALTQEELRHEECIGRNASARRFPLSLKTDDVLDPESVKKRGNVWDRLGKPAVKDRIFLAESDDIHFQNGLHKKAKLMATEHELRYRMNSSTEGDLFDIETCRRFSTSHTVQAHEHAEKPNRSRLIGRINFGDIERNELQARDIVRQKSSSTLPGKSVPLQSRNEFTSEVKSSLTAVSEPACPVSKSPKGQLSGSSKVAQLATGRNLESEVLQSQQVSSPAQSKTGSSVHEDGGNCCNKPTKDEMLDIKLKIKQMELDVLKLRSKQAHMNNVKQGVPSSGPHANSEEDADSRTVLVTNVHFAAKKEALSVHFMKCGTVLKINMLTDAITGHPKGAAFITFDDKESVEKAVSLSGSSFFSRVLTVMRKAEAPSGFLASVQPIGRPLQSWNSPPIQKGVNPRQTPSYHLQWKREQSVLEKSPASCPTN
uniref:RRM domain-containing protein n=1 Tax=Leersia perrieri TaxID=77586 RepID=A0A0D9W3E0_9ORYZ